MPNISWQSDIVLTAPHRLGGCDIGDVDPAYDGGEIVATCATGDLLMAYREGGRWRQKSIYRGEGELILCSTGRLFPDRAESQIVCAGMLKGEESDEGPGQVVLVWEEGGSWRSERVWQSEKLVHTAIITRGKEPSIVAGDYTGRVVLLRRDGAGGWRPEVIFQGKFPIKHIIEGEFAPPYDRTHLVLVDTGGAVTLIRQSGGGWEHETIYQSHKGLNRIGIYTPISSTPSPQHLVVAGNGGELVLLQIHRGAWKAVILHRGGVKLRGAVGVGNDVATADYAGNILLIRGGESIILFHDTGAIHHVAARELGGIFSIAACGHSGRLILLQCR